MEERKGDVVKQSIEFYDTFASEYAEAWFHKSLEKHLRRFVSMLPKGRPVLDAGGGHGRDTLALEGMGVRAVLLDLSIRLMKEGRERGVTAPMVQADLRHVPFTAGAFGGIWACASLVHLPRDEALPALKELGRVSSDDGALFLSVREGDGAGWEYLPNGAGRFYVYYRAEDVLQMLSASGWKTVQWQIDSPHWISVWARKKAVGSWEK